MPRPATPATPADLPTEDGVPVPGEIVTMEAVQPSAEQVAQDRSNRKARTGQQAFQGATVVTVLVWLLRLAGADLNPVPDGDDIPPEVATALGALLTYAAAVWMNRE